MGKIAILMLEDSPLDADLARAHLAKSGIEHEAERVETRQDFSAALQDRCYDVILADYSLPNFSGLEGMEIARELAPHVPFLFVSGVLGEEVAIEMLQRGATDYVLKSKLNRLAPAVTRALAEAAEKRERQRVQAALRDSELRYRTLLEALPQLIWTCNEQGECEFVNSKWIEYTGEKNNNLIPRWLDRVHPEDRQAYVEREWRQAVGTGSEMASVFRFRGVGQSYRWFQSCIFLMKTGDSKTRKWFGSFTDIEAQKETEVELRRQSEALARSNSDLQQFAYIASHDLQEPLRSVISYTQLLRRRYESRLDSDADDFIHYAVEGATRMQELIQDLLAYARAGLERDQNRTVFPAERALARALESLRARVRESETVVEQDPLPRVYANETELEQVFQNLLSNSIKYARPGEPPRIQIRADLRETQWMISVIDNGVGFEPEQADRIFGIFQRLHGRDVPGTGIGLTICKRIIESSGGEIWAEGKPGQGATFRFTLPAQPPASP